MLHCMLACLCRGRDCTVHAAEMLVLFSEPVCTGFNRVLATAIKIADSYPSQPPITCKSGQITRLFSHLLLHSTLLTGLTILTTPFSWQTRSSIVPDHTRVCSLLLDLYN